MSRKLFIGVLFSFLILFGTQEIFAQKTSKTAKRNPLKNDRNSGWFLTFAKALDYAEDHPDTIVILVNRAKTGKDAPLTKLEKDASVVLNGLKLGVTFKIFSGSSDTQTTYYSLFTSNDMGDNSFDSTGEEFQTKAKELAEKIKATNP